MAENFYGTLAEADEYHAARGNTAWVQGTDAERTASLIRASSYIDGRAGQKCASGCTYRWPGTKTGGRAQVLAWPRTGAQDIDGTPIGDDEVPFEVIQATYEGALRELENPGSLLPDVNPSQVVRRERVDVIETEYAVSSNGDTPIAPVFGVINGLLAGVLFCRTPGPVMLVV